MMKFFRRNLRTILAVLTVFIMVAFVGGTALTTFLAPRPGSQVIAQAFGRPLQEAQRNAIRRQTAILDRLISAGYFFPWRTPWGFAQTLPPLEIIDYLLLIEEAKAAGAQPSLEQARARLQQQQTDLTQFRLDARVSQDDLEQAVANFLMVEQQWRTAEQNLVVSALELRREMRDLHEKLNLSMVVLNAEALLDDHELISDEELESHFAKYKSQSPGEGYFDFGYLKPDQLQAEYLEIDTASIEPTKKITERMAERHWQENRTEFRRPEDPDPPEDQTSSEDNGQGDTSEDPNSKAGQPYGTFDEARDAVFEALRHQARIEEAQQMAELILSHLIDPWRDQPEGEDGYPLTPRGVAEPDYYGKVLERLQEALQHPSNIQTARTELFALNEADAVEGLGSAREEVGTGGPSRRFGSLLQRVQGLTQKPATGPETVALASHQTAPVILRDAQNNSLYLFRVTKTVLSSPPQSLKEVREQVVADVRKAYAFDAAGEHALRIKESVLDRDLERAWENYDGIEPEMKDQAGTWFEAQPLARKNQELFPGFRFPLRVVDKTHRGANTFQSEWFVRRVYDLVADSGDQAVVVIDVRHLGKCFVVKLAGINHLTQDEYDRYEALVRAGMRRGRLAGLREEWFSRGDIRSRARFEIQ